MPISALPKPLASSETLERLVALLLEKQALQRTVKVRDFGLRVTDPDEARRLFARVIRFTREAIGLGGASLPDPELVFTNRLSRLPLHAFTLYLLFLPVSLLFLYYAVHQSEGGAALWFVFGTIFFLLITPLLLHRRTRLNIEHGCRYVRNGADRTAILIDQLPSIQFQSYLAHEYAHHLYFQKFGQNGQEWNREGWARLVQWEVVRYLYCLEGNPAYLHHALVQIIGELKFACQVISMTLHQRLPRKVKRIPTIYQRNPLWRFLTGTPGFDMTRLLDHAIGTASYFLAEQRRGLNGALRGELFMV